MQPAAPHIADVTVIGGGLAGMAAALHLAKAGLRVVCIEPETHARQPVGESLDWSSPGLLSALDLPVADLIDSGIATYKRGVTLKPRDGPSKEYAPGPWLGRAPFNVELRTMHVDRRRLDQDLLNLAISRGVTVVHDKVVTVEKKRERVTAVNTALGARFATPWFIDASGSATSLFARTFELPVIEYGPHKVAIWAYFTAPLSHEGTTIYADAQPGSYLEWIWEIPISPHTLSVGSVTTGETIKNARQQGLTIQDIFETCLKRFPRLESLLQMGADDIPCVTSFKCRTYKGVSGPNWMIVGEAASLVDPITSNGVTAALRHAAEASALIVECGGRSELPFVAGELYSRRVLQMSRFFNSGIEQLVYDWPVRDRIGIESAATVYTAAAWIMNAVYARLRPRGMLSTLVFGVVLGLLRASARMTHRWCRHLIPAR
jgi:flavin-dependent dehydrogenase